MFQQPIMELEQQEELTLDQKLKKYKDERIENELSRALKRTGKSDSKNLFTMLQEKQKLKQGEY